LNGLSQGVANAYYATVDDDVYVPLRAITEMLGFVPRWNEADNKITVYSPRGEISLRVGEWTYNLSHPFFPTTAHGLKPPVIIKGRTYVPMRFFCEVFGFTNAWFEGGTVFIDNSGEFR
jgi:hypothetical protein